MWSHRHVGGPAVGPDARFLDHFGTNVLIWISRFSGATLVLLPSICPTTPDGSVRGGPNGGVGTCRVRVGTRRDAIVAIATIAPAFVQGLGLGGATPGPSPWNVFGARGGSSARPGAA